jgi:hypothetical protein
MPGVRWLSLIGECVVSLKNIILYGLIVLAYVQPVFTQQGQGRADSQVPPPPEMTGPVDAAFVPPVESRAQALEVLSVMRRDHHVLVRVKNVSEKNIYSFRMKYHKRGSALSFSFIMRDDKTALAPGEVYEYEHSLIPDSPLAREPLTFEAVLFEDGSGDGDADKVESLQDLFLKSRTELEQVTALLQAAINSPGVETSEGLSDLEMKVSAIPNFIYGMEMRGLAGTTLPAWRETAMHLIRDIKRKKREDEGVKIQDELTKMKERFSKSLAKYPGAI